MRHSVATSIAIFTILLASCERMPNTGVRRKPGGTKPIASAQKQQAQEKLLLLRKQQVLAKIADLEISIDQDLATLAKNNNKLESAEKAWRSERVGTFDTIMNKQSLDRESKDAQKRLDKFLGIVQELRREVADIDRQLERLYTEVLKK